MRVYGGLMEFNGIYPLVNIQKAIENGHRNSEFSHQQWWFSMAMLNNQMVDPSSKKMGHVHPFSRSMLHVTPENLCWIWEKHHDAGIFSWHMTKNTWWFGLSKDGVLWEDEALTLKHRMESVTVFSDKSIFYYFNMWKKPPEISVV